MSEKELRALCGIWQRRLRLQDWNVTVRIGRYHDMKDGSVAQCWHYLKRKTAEITILSELDYEPGTAQHQEMDLVHELLHLHFAPFRAEDDSMEQVAQEQAIHALSQALVELARRSDEYGHRGHLDNDN